MKYTDHIGNEFISLQELCNHYHITTTAYQNRIRNHWSVQDALTTPVSPKNRTIIDHEGHEFPSISKCAEYWNMPFRLLQKRLNSGWDIKDAILTQSSKPTGCKDHLGNEFATKRAMCKHYNISTWTLRDRLIVQKMSLKEALTAEQAYFDPFGQKFTTQREMLDYYHCERGSYKTRMKLNWSALECLEIIPRIKTTLQNTEIVKGYTVKHHIENNYYLCELNNNEIVQSYDNIINTALSLLLEEKRSQICEENHI